MKYKLFYFFSVLGLILWAMISNVQAGVNIFDVPRQLPQNKIINQNGQKFSLADFKGDFVLAHFWSRDCAPCLKELKGLNMFHNKVKQDNIRLIMISPQSEWFDFTEQARFLKKYGAPDLEFYVEENDNLSADFGIFTTPHTVIISPQSKEIGRLKGSESWNQDKVIKFIKKLKEKIG